MDQWKRGAGIMGHVWRTSAHEASEEAIYRAMYQIAETIGRLLPGRQGKLIERVVPKLQADAPTNSPSRTVGLSEIAFHLDGAHHTVPPRYLILACAATDGYTQTRLIDTDKWNFTKSEVRLLQTAVFFISSGRKSFYGSIFGSEGRMRRFDPYCMHPAAADADRAAALINKKIDGSQIDLIHWQIGDIVVLDNRRMLHARGEAPVFSKRVLLRGAVL